MERNTSISVSNDGSIEYKHLTQEYLDDALKVMTDSFFIHENMHKAIEVVKDPLAIPELIKLCAIAAEDGVSVVAVEKSTNKVVAALFNKLQVKSDVGEEPFFEKFARECKSLRAKAIVELMMEIDSLCDLFTITNADCLIEIMFLGTLPEARGKGVASKLCELTLEIATKLNRGINVKISLNDQPLSLQPIPKAATAIFTSFISQKIGKQLGFTIAIEKSYEEYSFEGRKFSDVISDSSPTFALEYKLIQ